MKVAAGLASLALALADAPPRPQQAAGEPDIADIVVTARGTPPARLDPIVYLRLYCFDPARLRGSPEPPTASYWVPLDPETRTRFGAQNPEVQAFGLVDPVRRLTLLLKLERFDRPARVVEHRCTLAVFGTVEERALADAISNLFRGPGTQRHVDHPDGVPSLPGWKQWLWSAMPGRGSKGWRSVNATGRRDAGATWVVVTDPSFYAAHDHVLTDLKVRKAGHPLALVTFAFSTRWESERR
jgi:hypothetical protein